MVKRGGLLTAGVTAFAVATVGPPARADSPAPARSYKVVAPGGKYVFVMIAPGTLEDDARHWNEETAAGIREIRRVYPRSGLYRNDGLADPLWTVDFYALGVEVASDGVHLVRHGPWAALPGYVGYPGNGTWESALDQEGLSFFASGRLLRTYRIGELVSGTERLPRSVSHFTWVAEGRLDDARLEYALTTKDGNRFVFDLRTGEVVSESRATGPAGRVWWGVGVMAAVAAVAWLAWRLRARPRAAAAEPPLHPTAAGYADR